MTSAQADEDLEVIRPTSAAKASGGIMLLGGVFTVLLGVQTALVWRASAIVGVALILMFGLGSVLAFSGWLVARVRGWASLTGAIAGGTMAVFGLGWAIFALLNGLFSPLSLLVVPLNALGSLLALVRLGPGRRADAARERLRDQGLEAGN